VRGPAWYVDLVVQQEQVQRPLVTMSQWDGFGEDLVADEPMEAVGGSHIDLPAEQLLGLAARACVAAGDRAEDADVAKAVPLAQAPQFGGGA
jgi:hypothetical protein